MKYILQLPIFILMMWASAASYATCRLALSDRNIEAYITKVSVGGSTHRVIGLISCKYALKNAKCMGSQSQTSTIRFFGD